jgi:hypothetical protein
MHKHAHQHAAANTPKVKEPCLNERHGKQGLIEQMRAARTLEELDALATKGVPEGASTKSANKLRRAYNVKKAEFLAGKDGSHA